MSATRTCPVCGGTKKSRQIGMMYATCAVCDGAGVVDADKFQNLLPAQPQIAEHLPAGFFDAGRDKDKARLKSANYAYMNKPVAASDVQKLSDIGKPKAAKSPLPPTEDELNAIRAQVSDKARENAPTQQVELSEAMKAQLDALEKPGKKAYDKKKAAGTKA